MHLGELQYIAQRYKEMQQELKDNSALHNKIMKQIPILEKRIHSKTLENSEITSKILNAEKDKFLIERVLGDALEAVKGALTVSLSLIVYIHWSKYSSWYLVFKYP